MKKTAEKIIKHVEVKTYEYKEIKVSVFIDYDKQTISLVERNGMAGTHANFDVKKWVFANRSHEYMQGWLNILEAMQYAITQATKELEDYYRPINERLEKLMEKK